MLTKERLKVLLKYDWKTGIFTWLLGRGNTAHKGDVAGTVATLGGKNYILMSVDGKRYLAHRLAFLYITGQFPPSMVDHDDGDGLNNAFLNLRYATAKTNMLNCRLYKNNTSGITGVKFNINENRWVGDITKDGNRHTKLFDDFFEAVCYRKSLEISLKFNKNHGSVRSTL